MAKKTKATPKDEKVLENQETVQETIEPEVIVEEDETCACDIEATDEVMELKTLLKKALDERDEFLQMAQRSRAEFDNFRKRNEAQRTLSRISGINDTINSFFPILDNAERAMEAAKDVEEDDVLKKGINMILSQFAEVLGSLGVSKIEAVGKEFDPNFHHAVVTEDANDEFPANTVTEVFMDGYIMDETVLRYAMVKVAK